MRLYEFQHVKCSKPMEIIIIVIIITPIYSNPRQQREENVYASVENENTLEKNTHHTEQLQYELLIN
jgi:hypothetical protein